MSTPPEDEPYTGPPATRPPVVAPPVWPGGYPPDPRLLAPGWALPPGPYGYGSPPYPYGGLPYPYGGPPYPYGTPPFPPSMPPGMRWEPPPGTPPHDEPQPFLRAMRSRTWAWWRPIAGLALLSVVYAVGALAVVLVALVTGVGPDLALLNLTDPWVLLITNVSLILFIPCVWFAWAVAHGMRIGWSASVLARIRPRLLLPYTRMALVSLGIALVLSVGVGVLLDPGSVTGPLPELGWLLLVVFLTTPLQSAAEEYLFRGYLSQMIAGWFRSARVGAITAAVVTATVFSLAHAPPDFWTFLDRFLFALAASATVWLTGGLEAAIVLHAVNNVLVFTMAGVLGEGITTDEVPSGAGFLFVLITTAAMTAYVALVRRSGQRLRPERETGAQDLRPPSTPPSGPPPGPVPAPWHPAFLPGR